MTSADADDALGPYASAAQMYWNAGWSGGGILPLPPRRKASPPKGYTGADGVVPSAADIYAWAEGEEGNGNIGLRLPRHVIGIDVDNYAGKAGAAELAKLVERIGVPLPATWSTSSRHETGSGISLYTVPEGLAWPGDLAPGIDIIQFRHRYAVVWPSVHPEGGVYRWRDPSGNVALNAVPSVDELPALPEQWVNLLTRGEAETDIRKAALDDVQRNEWLNTHGAGEPCREMKDAVTRYVSELVIGARSRHAIASDGTYRICRMISEGHHGGAGALAAIKTAFDHSFARNTTREYDPNEWARLIEGAVARSAVDARSKFDPCSNPFAALLEPDELTRVAARAALLAARSEPTPLGPSASSPPDAFAELTEAHDPLSTSISGSSYGEDWSDLLGSAAPAPVPPPVHAPLTPDIELVATYPAEDPMIALARDAMVRQEYERQLARREAKRLLDAEDHVRNFRVPEWRPTLREELALPDDPEEYLVDRLIPVGGNVLLAAQFKSGKSSTMVNLVRALADREPFVEEFEVRKARKVSIFNYEVSEGQFRRWLRDAALVNEDRVNVLNLRGYSIPITVPFVQDWVVDYLKQNEITTWIVDPFARAMIGSGDENSNVDVATFTDALDIIKERAGVQELVLVCHTGRAEFAAGKERARGATRLDDWADVRWLLNLDDDGDRFFRATGRDVELPEGKLEWNSETRRQKWVEGEERAEKGKKEIKKAPDLLDLSSKILIECRAEPGISESALARILHKRTTKIREEVVKLESAGYLCVEAGKAKNDTTPPTRMHFLTALADSVSRQGWPDDESPAEEEE